MYRKSLITLGTFLLFGFAVINAATNKPVFATQDSGISQAHLEQIAARFRKLRTIPGHFGGGTWNDDVDRWMGPKHRLMIELGTHLGHDEFQKSDIIELLNPPDHIARKGDRLYNQIINFTGYDESPAASYEFLIYYWRGRHDFLFFSCKDGKIFASDWWYEGD